MDKRDRAALFRLRLSEAMSRRNISQAALARACGVDRSTLSALLSPSVRMPNAQLAADCATALGVSSDWLLGLSLRPEPVADLLATSLTITEAPRALIDETIFGWHREAAGYKIRHVPATLPDMLKTRAVVDWEYAPQLGRSAGQAIGAFEDRLAWMRGARSDYEIALPLHELDAFAHAEGYYRGLGAEVRLEQLDRLIELCEQLYPSLRLCLFDARRVFSAPVTVFGPLLAVVYLGRSYIAFRDAARVQSMTDHFDWLVREAEIGARDAAQHLRQLKAQIRD
ncbi:helix-turn-helix transcriptional regulator [Xinfangfangia sp. CPCC 101601]|uniref:Helix-turn-helix transcriptional regulator n=1 Tax=Pseudogemmobacter lacusdianii TaxID=3069608 RepID=A0ABU0VV94_9RHOB|nr:helix-turn-helix transcriptional regulator [Xinfangfangia sp. CPCC 101601]MDQ2065662.1 helix-turn-helix transcriptional regulator [Xinfangfangia sp. CPCC 101601]